MSHHHSDNSNQQYYEGDQSKLYSGIMNHHFGHDVKSTESKKQMGRIWKVFWILLVITIVEVCLGMFFSHAMPKALIAFFFLALTLLKAAYIVKVFMHLGDEKKSLRQIVLGSYAILVGYLIYICLAEATYNEQHKAGMEVSFKALNEATPAHAHGESHGAAHETSHGPESHEGGEHH